jgi:hypothetical protein
LEELLLHTEATVPPWVLQGNLKRSQSESESSESGGSSSGYELDVRDYLKKGPLEGDQNCASNEDGMKVLKSPFICASIVVTDKKSLAHRREQVHFLMCF